MAVSGQTSDRSFDRLLLDQLGLVRYIGARSLRDRGELDDFTQEVVLRVYASPRRLHEPDHLGRWVSVVARNTAKTWNQKRRPVAMDPLPDTVLPGPSPDERLEERERWSALVDALGRLSEDDRDLLRAYYIEGVSAWELGRRLRISHAALRARLCRARRTLRARLAAYFGLVGWLVPTRPSRRFGEVPYGGNRMSAAVSFTTSLLIVAGVVAGAFAAEIRATARPLPTDFAGDAPVSMVWIDTREHSPYRLVANREHAGHTEAEGQAAEGVNVVPGATELAFDRSNGNTFINSLTVALQAMDEPATYDEVMGFSGAAFRLHFHQPDWCPSSPDATCGFDHGPFAAQAYGYEGGLFWSDESDPAEMAEAKRLLMQSIDAGRPVPAIDLVEVPDWGVVLGYSDDAETLLCRDYHAESDALVKARKWPWFLFLLGERTAAPSRGENVRNSLDYALELATTTEYDDYASGFTAFDIWMGDLLDATRFAEEDADGLQELTHTNAWCYLSLTDARASAARYLRSVENELGAASATHLSNAAGLYDQVVQTLRDGRQYAPFPGQLPEAGAWTAEMRSEQVAVMRQVLSLERKAVEELRAARERAIVSN